MLELAVIDEWVRREPSVAPSRWRLSARELASMMLDRVAWDPARFIEAARLTDGAGDFEARCEQFMWQFPRLNGWPRDRSALEA